MLIPILVEQGPLTVEELESYDRHAPDGPRVLKVVQEVGKSGGYTIILEKTESSIVYADENIDISDEVIKAFDKQGK